MTSKKILALMAVLALAGCGSRSAPVVEHAAQREAPRILGSRVKVYRDIREVKREATAVVVATATSASIEKVSGIPFTVTRMRVVDTVRGNVPSTFDLRQTGSTAMQAEGTELVVEGGTYLLFVQPFEFTHGVTTGQYVAVGVSAGVYRQVGRDDFSKTDRESSIPAHIKRADAA